MSTTTATQAPSQYHTDKDSKYALPADVFEHERLAEQSRNLLALMDKKIVHAPVDLATARHVIDVGCGTGDVTDYLGKQFPYAQVVGLDLSAIFDATKQDRPSNVHFLQGNFVTKEPHEWAASELEISNGTAPLYDKSVRFDYIYSRLLVAGITDWPGLVKREFELAKSGGWVELHECDFTVFNRHGNMLAPLSRRTPGIAVDDDGEDWTWYDKFCKHVTEEIGLDLFSTHRIPDLMRSAGFVNVEVKKYRWPHGEGEDTEMMRRFGRYHKRYMSVLYTQMVARLMPQDTPPEELKRMQHHVVQSLVSDKGRYFEMTAMWGMKP